MTTETVDYYSLTKGELISALQAAKNNIDLLKKEINDMSKLRTLSQELQLKNNNLENRINQLHEDKLQITATKNEEIVELQRKLTKLQLEFDSEIIKFKKKEEIYQQKMDIIHVLEKDNWEYYEEVKDLKEKNLKLKAKNEQDLNSKDIENKIKYEKLKKKLVQEVKDAKNNIKKLNLKYMDVSDRLIILQNQQLLIQIEYLVEKIRSLEEENTALRKRLFEMHSDMKIHQNVEINLATDLIKNKTKSMMARVFKCSRD